MFIKTKFFPTIMKHDVIIRVDKLRVKLFCQISTVGGFTDPPHAGEDDSLFNSLLLDFFIILPKSWVTFFDTHLIIDWHTENRKRHSETVITTGFDNARAFRF
ncbi:MAG: hypothetical protein ACD_41C00013G0001 [uncultured bacterium]|nr:MAG: hypothetical protein ACD_41C00013G0001 [uncultured bacterium]